MNFHREFYGKQLWFSVNKGGNRGSKKFFVGSDFGRISPGAKFLNQSENIKSPRSAKSPETPSDRENTPVSRGKKLLRTFWGAKRQNREVGRFHLAGADWSIDFPREMDMNWDAQKDQIPKSRHESRTGYFPSQIDPSQISENHEKSETYHADEKIGRGRAIFLGSGLLFFYF